MLQQNIISSRSPKQRRLRVMIADDIQETRRSTRLMLSMIPDVRVIAIAHNGREAVQLARKYRPDIAIMDVNMPQVDGLRAIRALQQTNPDMVCIVMSAERDSQVMSEAMAVGAQDFLIKPFTLEELEEAIRKAKEIIKEKQARQQKLEEQRAQRELWLKQKANQFIEARRTDNEALRVFEALAADPQCESRWLMYLAVIYVFRQQWRKLRILAERLERQTKISA